MYFWSYVNNFFREEKFSSSLKSCQKSQIDRLGANIPDNR
jgi:hypothetical protein